MISRSHRTGRWHTAAQNGANCMSVRWDRGAEKALFSPRNGKTKTPSSTGGPEKDLSARTDRSWVPLTTRGISSRQIPFQRPFADLHQRHYGGRLLYHDGAALAAFGHHFLCDGSGFHPFYPVPDQKGAAPFPQAFREAGGIERFYGGNHFRPQNHQGLPSGSHHAKPV